MTKIVKAVKSSYVKAREAYEGEEIETFNSEGFETKNIANCGDVIVTAVDENGVVIVRNGHPNVWIMNPKNFNDRYVVTERSGLYHSKGKPQVFMVLDHDSTFVAPWGEKQVIKKGGLLNISSFDDIYGIGRKEFEETYVVLEEKEF